VQDNAAFAEFGLKSYAALPLFGSGQHLLGALCVCDTQPHPWPAEAVAILDDLAAVAIAELRREAASAEQVRRNYHRQGLLAVVRHLAAEPQPQRVLRALVEAAVSLLGMDDGGVARWDAGNQVLVQVESFLPSTNTGAHLDLAATASGRAAMERRLIVWADYQRMVGQSTPAGRAGAQLVAALPLQHEGRLLGTLSVSAFAPGSSLPEDDAAVLELLASLTAAVLVGQERARLAGAVLAALTAQHELANALTAVSASVQLIRRMPDLPTSVRERADTAIQRASFAAARLQKLQELSDLVETDWGRVGRTIDVDRSI
jgi:GAF domain-containing protein